MQKANTLEEFKATSLGLVAYFLNHQEGLLHLMGAFESLSFDGVRLGVHWERVGD